MESASAPPLDEIQWRSPEAIQEMGGIHTNTVLHYFARSPFYDATSNNATLTTQAMYNQNLSWVIGTRTLFEERLRSMQGLEFMVVQDPSEGDTKPFNSGVWVIRKQTRRKRGGMPDEITSLNSYFVVGENIYMAPRLGDIVTNRMLNVVMSLNGLMTKATTLPLFSAAKGHTYVDADSVDTSSSQNVAVKLINKEISPLPDAQSSTPKPDSHGLSDGNVAEPLNTINADDDLPGMRLFAESWDLAFRYGNDYMDENPLVGEPGNFKLSKTHNLALATAKSSGTAQASQPFQTPTKVPATGSRVLPTSSESTSVTDSGKTTVGLGPKEKKARRKSKAGGAITPKATTPGVTTPAG